MIGTERGPTRRALGAALLAAAALPRGALAQDFPNRPVRLVVALAPGGPTDTVARLMAPKLSELWGQPVVVENRPGAGQVIGTGAVARAPGDGHTLLVTTNTLAVNPWLFPNLPYNTEEDLVPIMQISTSPLVLAVNPAVPARSLADLIRLAREKPGELHFSSGGASSSPRMAAELLNAMAEIRTVHVAYTGSGPATNALLAGDVQFAFVNPVFHEIMQSGRLRPLAVTGRERLQTMPAVPTLAEAGLPGYLAGSWFGLVAPRHTPQPVLARIHRDFAQVLRMPEIRTGLERQDQDIVASSPEEFRSFIGEELARWKSVVERMNITVQ